MLKKSIALIVIAAISSSVIAAERQTYRIISHKVEVSPGDKGWFESIEQHSIDRKDLVNSNAETYAQAYDAVGYVDQNISLYADHSFSIFNETTTEQTYTYRYELNCNGQYFKMQDVIQVDPSTGYMAHERSYLTVYITSPGDYSINASTALEGETHSQSINVATLQVKAN